MKKIAFLLLSIAFVATGCMRCTDSTLYQSSGRQKPIVAVLPVIDSTHDRQLSWELSEEFTKEIKDRIYNSSKLYLLKDCGTETIARALNAPNPSALPRSATEKLGAAEFVIVSEILQQDEDMYGFAKPDHPFLGQVGGMLRLALRLRVLDIRGSEPKVILQEVLDCDHVIARCYLHSDYQRHSWGTEAFLNTPMGIAHNKIVRELVAHAEGYIGAAKG